MATRTVDEVNKCIFLWEIKNLSSLCMKKGEGIESPTFVTDALENTKWSLSSYPMGSNNENYVSVNLHREIDWNGPTEIEVNYEFTFEGKDGSILSKIHLESTFRKPERWGWHKFVEREKVFVSEKEAYLPDDTLTVKCTIWKKEHKLTKPEIIFARTVFEINRRSFIWRIPKFSTLQSSPARKWKDSLIEFDLVLNDETDIEKKIILAINLLNENIRYFSLETSILDFEGNKENCGIHKFFPNDLKKGVVSSLTVLTTKWMGNKSRYLPNDVLTLNCEQVISCQKDFYEFLGYGITFSTLANEEVESRCEHYADLKSMYDDAIFSDTELRTRTKAFPAHKNILSARSPVFRRMFSNDMKEKNAGYVNIDDMDDDTVHRMLTYMYTVSLEDLQFESALKLYAAADKYGIMSLRNRCSSFMKGGLCPTKACEVFLLADQHHDVDLKCFVQDYMLEHDQEVFGSPEWIDFIDTHPKFAATIMRMKYSTH